MREVDIAHIASQLKAIGNNAAKIGDASTSEEFLKIIHRPGFTTPAEAKFLTAIVDVMHSQTQSLLDLRAAMQAAAALVMLNPQPEPPIGKVK